MRGDRYFGISRRIARWKEPSGFEESLAEAAVNSPDARRLYAEYYRHLDEDYYDKGKVFAEKLYNENHETPRKDKFDEIYVDMVYCLHRYGLSFQDYCIYGLWNKSEICRKGFVSDKLRYHYCDILNGKDINRLMTDKYACYEAYRPFFKRTAVPLLNLGDKDKFLEFIKDRNRFIYKPLCDHSGHGIAIIRTASIEPERWFEETVSKNPGIAEEIIIQGEELNKLNPGSVNTCRVAAFNDGGEVTLIGVTLRIGVGDSIKDNAGSGGIYASVDPETGTIQSDAKNYRNQHFLFHPTTKCQIIGYQLPQWSQAKDLIRSMATHRDGTTLVAWDIVYSEKGWCMVEANENGDWSIIQSNLERGKKAELYKLMDKYFAKNKL